MRRLVRSFEDDDIEDAAPGAATSEAEYVFDGFNVDFSTKVMLTPAVAPSPATAPIASAQSRRR